MFEKLKGYLSFKGRLNRVEYLKQCATVFVAIMVGVGIASAIFLSLSDFLKMIVLLICLVFYILSTLILIAASVKRLHDMGFSGYWVLIQAIPFVGIVLSLAVAVWPGQDTDNRYGPVSRKKSAEPKSGATWPA